MSGEHVFNIFVNENESGVRLDSYLASHISYCSRSCLTNLILKRKILVGGTIKKPGYKIKPRDRIYGVISQLKPISLEPEPLKINVLYEDNDIIVINKQAGLVVHPAPNNYTGTLANGLIYHWTELKTVGDFARAGIVHRLDKDTSGAMVIAKNQATHDYLCAQFKSRKIQKNYLALVYGEVKSDSGTILLPIGRHPTDRKKMSTISSKSRYAETLWNVRERFQGITLLDLNLKTGRTHQIRVHCAAISHPVIGDVVYGRRKTVKKLSVKRNIPNAIFSLVSRQMLHAQRLEFIHPATKTTVSFDAPVPKDMTKMMKALESFSLGKVQFPIP